MPSILDMTDQQIDRMKYLAKLVKTNSEVYPTYSTGVVYENGKKKNVELTEEEILFKMFKGSELNLPPLAALTALYNEHGTLTMHAETAMGLLFATGRVADYHMESTNEFCRIKILCKGWSEPTVYEFTIEDAKKAGLLNKDKSETAQWKIREKVMLQHRCESALRRAVGPDVGLGIIYTTGELSGPEFYREGGLVDEIYGTALQESDGVTVETPTPKELPAPKKDKVVQLPPQKKDDFGAGKAGTVEPPEEEITLPDDDAAIEKAMDNGAKVIATKAETPTKADAFRDWMTKVKADNELTGPDIKQILEGAGLKALSPSSPDWTDDMDTKIRAAINGYVAELKLSRMPSSTQNGSNGNGKHESVTDEPVSKEDFDPESIYREDDDEEDDGPKIKMESKAINK